MRLLNILKFFLIVGAPPAFAFMPVASLRPAGCDRKISQVEDFRSLIQKVNVVGDTDDRDALSTFREISEVEQSQIAHQLGTIRCDGPSKSVEATAALIEDGGQIVTSAHLFADRTLRITKPLPSCYFYTKANPSRKIKLVLKEGSYIFGTTDPAKDHDNDYAFVRLAEPILDATPLRFGLPPRVGENLYLVTRMAKWTNKKIDQSQPIVRECIARNTYGHNGGSTVRSFTNDCDNAEGDSGGIYYARREGKLEVVGIHHGGGLQKANFQPYLTRSSDFNKVSYGLGVVLDDEILNSSKELARRASEMAGSKVKRRLDSSAAQET